MNYKINWEKLTEKEAQTIANLLASGFNLVAKSVQDNKLHDVSYLKVKGIYDDNIHSNEKAS